MADLSRKDKRPAPAYQRYAADSQVAPQFRLSLAAHGLLALMQDVQWLSDDDAVPTDVAELAFLIRRPQEEVARALPEILNMPSNDVDTSMEGAVRFIALRGYKEKLGGISKKCAKGAQITNEKRRAQAGAGASAPASAPAPAPLVPTQPQTQPQPQPQSVGGDSVLSKEQEKWAKDYTAAEHAAPHLRLARG